MDTVACPSCGEENPARFRLCGFCGTSLAPVPETIVCSGCGEDARMSSRILKPILESRRTEPWKA